MGVDGTIYNDKHSNSNAECIITTHRAMPSPSPEAWRRVSVKLHMQMVLLEYTLYHSASSSSEKGIAKDY